MRSLIFLVEFNLIQRVRGAGTVNVLRLSWSSYQDEASLEREENHLRERGFRYLRVEPHGPLPGKLAVYDALIVNSQFQVDDSFLESWSDGLILTASNGYDHVDVESCDERGIPVARTPAARSGPVVDHTFSLIDALLRDHHRTGRRLLDGEWCRAEAYSNIRNVSTSTIGVLGFGVIGRSVAARARERGFERVIAHDPLRRTEIEDLEGVDPVDRRTLLGESDVLTLHADLNPSTDHLIDADALQVIANDAFLVNTARGRMIDHDALLKALGSGDLAGAALDVFPDEPCERSWPEGLLTTPHSAGFSPDLLENLRVEVGDVLESYSQGERIKNRIRPRSDQESRRLESGQGDEPPSP